MEKQQNMEYLTNEQERRCDMDDGMNKFLEAVEQFCETIYQSTEILLANPLDLIELDLSSIPCNCYFISDSHVEKGTMLKIEDSPLKRDLYKFIEDFPDRVFRGKKW